MTKQFWSFLAVGLVAVGIVVSIVWFSNKGSHLELAGKILKVRTFSIDRESTLVVVDFRVTNTSEVPFQVGEVAIKLQPASGEAADGTMVSKRDVEAVFQAVQLVGPKFNDVLGPRDIIPPGKTLDRMAEARFEMPESAVQKRKSLVLHIEEADGASADLTEKP